MGQRLVKLALVEESFFGLKRAGKNDADLFAVGAIYTENARPGRRNA